MTLHACDDSLADFAEPPSTRVGCPCLPLFCTPATLHALSMPPKPPTHPHAHTHTTHPHIAPTLPQPQPSRYQTAAGYPDAAKECLLKRVRALGGAGWQASQEAFETYAQASAALCESYLQVGARLRGQTACRSGAALLPRLQSLALMPPPRLCVTRCLLVLSSCRAGCARQPASQPACMPPRVCFGRSGPVMIVRKRELPAPASLVRRCRWP